MDGYWSRDDGYWNGPWPNSSRVAFVLFFGGLITMIAIAANAIIASWPWDFGWVWHVVEGIIPFLPFYLVIAAIMLYAATQ